MSDQNVKAAQKYLNAMFGGHKDWVKLDEDGKTGTAVMQGIIRAFQIQNGISTITGTVGPLTINTMKKLAIISCGVFMILSSHGVNTVPVSDTIRLITTENRYAVCTPTCRLLLSFAP